MIYFVTIYHPPETGPIDGIFFPREVPFRVYEDASIYLPGIHGEGIPVVVEKLDYLVRSRYEDVDLPFLRITVQVIRYDAD